MRLARAGDPDQGLLATVEWPTLVLAVVIHGGWLALTWFHARLPFGMLAALGGWFMAWHGSLQHETIHGHPSRSRAFNALVGAVPLALWLPYRCYRRDHLAHHAAEQVTDPRVDPESRYLSPATGWTGTVAHAAAVIQAPLVGRLILGPPIVVAGFLIGEARRARRAPAAAARRWIPHLVGVLAITTWLSVCHLGLGRYLLAFVYPGTALTLLRSFAEHRASPVAGHRVAVVERAGPLALLFLHNNLHAVHHHRPGLPWYRIPAYYRRRRERILRANGGLLYRGYGEVVRRYGLRAHDSPVHPDLRPVTAAR